MYRMRHSGRKAIAALLAFSIMQVYVQANPASSIATASKEATASTSQMVIGKLITRGNQPILVNGNNAASGTTIMNGATLQTPPGVGATVVIGQLGELDFAPETEVSITYIPEQHHARSKISQPASSAEPGVSVKLNRGCLIAKIKQGLVVTVATPDGTVTKADQPYTEHRRSVDICFPVGATTPVVNAGAAANAGAGAGGGAGAAASTGAATAGGAAGTGVGIGVIAAIVAVVIVVVVVTVVATGGDDDNVSRTGTGNTL